MILSIRGGSFFPALGRRIMVEDPSGQTQFEYDTWDNLIALTDANNQRTRFEYDAVTGRLTKELRPMNQATTYEYDNLGRLQKTIDAKLHTTQYGYDAQSRLDTITYDDGKTVTLSYDADGNLAGYDDGTTSATYTYDDLGRKLSEAVDYGTFTKTFSSTYYQNGVKRTFTGPDGITYEYAYGNNNELREVQIPGLGAITIPDYTWNRLSKMTFPGGTQRVYGYDALMRLQSLTVNDPGGNPLLDYAYTYDNVGNIETKTTEHGTYGYDYDGSSRLTGVDNPVLDDESYTYDDVGNRLTAADVNGTWNYNANNELLGYADVEYDYDENGNLTQIKVGGQVVWIYVYDAANRLVHVEDGTGSISADYYYDPFGRRLWKEVGGVRTYFFYSDEGLIGEYDASGNELKTYGYKPDSTWTTDPLWLKEGSTYYWYQNDHLGTPQKLVAVNGAVVWSAQYSSFGKTDVQVEIVTNNLRFPGQYEDEETGLHYNYFRYYDPKIGRYLRIDPIGLAGGDMNLYGYGKNNALKTIDPLGLNEVIITGGINVNYHGWEKGVWRIAASCSGPIDFSRVCEYPLTKFRNLLSPLFDIGHDRKWSNFVLASIEKIKERKQTLSPCEEIEWHVETESYMYRAMMDEHGNGMAYLEQIRQDAAELGVILREFGSKEEFIHNLNYSHRGARRTGHERISFLAYFGHGYPNAFGLQYNTPWFDSPYHLTSDDILQGKLSKEAFIQGSTATLAVLSGKLPEDFCPRSSTVISYGCRSATPNDLGQSMKSAWEEYLGVKFYGAVGRTSYYDTPIVGLEEGAYWDPEQLSPASYDPLMSCEPICREMPNGGACWNFPQP